MSVYNDDWSWIKDYTKNYVILNAGEPMEGTIQVPHVGYNIHAYVDWIAKNYDNLPKTVMFIKGTIFKKCISQEEFDKVCNKKTFTPLLKQDHFVDGAINKYVDGIYYESNNSWWFDHFPHKHVNSYDEFCLKMGIPKPESCFNGFAPGACYIVPRDNIKRRTKEFYQTLASLMDYDPHPSEAHCGERAFITIWNDTN
jgi:hypothetical protein